MSIRGSVAFVWRLTNVGIFTMINPRTGEAICEESLGSLSDIWVETSQKANFVREFTNAISDKGYGLGFHSFRVKALDRDGEYCWWEMRYNISEENERRVANGFTFSVQNEMSREESLIVAKNKSDRINAVVQEMMGPIKSLTKSGSLLKSGGLSNEQELAEIENIDKNIEMRKGLSEHIQSISEGEA